ncbi:hypothetical protein DFH27DRAFT_608747 [Peziza echinospora]|nr:hypothetical protein DFH27DRAFT_608747 [Peziza echinospora]
MAPPRKDTPKASTPRSANQRKTSTTQPARKVYKHSSLEIPTNISRSNLMIMCRALDLDASGDLDALRSKLNAEVVYHKLDSLKNLIAFRCVFFPSRQELSSTPASHDVPEPSSAVTDDFDDVLTDVAKLDALEEQSRSLPYLSSDGFFPDLVPDTQNPASNEPQDSQMQDVTSASQMPPSNMSPEEIAIAIFQLRKAVADHKATLNHHSEIGTLHGQSIKKMVPMTMTSAFEVRNLRRDTTELQLALADSMVDLQKEIQQANESLTALKAGMASVGTRTETTERNVDSINVQLDNVVNMQNFTNGRTEIQDRWMRSHNILVFGWTPFSSPRADAAAFLERIEYRCTSFSARRLPPTRVGDVERPGLLCITFSSPSESIEALMAFRSHSGGSRDMQYYAKPDMTKQQRDQKLKADAGVRILRERYPGRNYCERAGRIALFKPNDRGMQYLAEWVQNPLDPNAPEDRMQPAPVQGRFSTVPDQRPQSMPNVVRSEPVSRPPALDAANSAMPPPQRPQLPKLDAGYLPQLTKLDTGYPPPSQSPKEIG